MRISPAIAIPAFSLLGGLVFMAGRYSATRGPVGEGGNTRVSSRNPSALPGTASGSRNPKRPTETTEARRAQNLARLKEILADPDLVSRSAALTAHLSQLAPLELEDAGRLACETSSPSDRSGDRLLIIQAWVSADPEKSMDTLKTLPKHDMMQDAIREWATLDPEAAIAWAHRNKPKDGSYLHGIIEALAVTDLPRATKLMEDSTEELQINWTMSSIFQRISSGEPADTRKWIESIKHDSVRSSAMQCVMGALSELDTAGTVTWLVGRESPEHYHLHTVFENWAKKDFPAALASFESLPSGTARTHALSGLISISSGKDEINGPLALIARYPDDVIPYMRTEALYRYAGDHPAAALAKVSTIADPDDINSTYSEILSRWRVRDSEAARAWMDANEPPQKVEGGTQKGDVPLPLDLPE